MDRSSPLVVHIGELRQHPIDVELDEAPSRLDLNADEIEFTSRVTGHLAWRWVDQRVVAMGRLSARAKTPCVRCLRDVELSIDVDARLAFSNLPPVYAEIEEIGMDDEGVTHFTGDVIDAAEDVRALLLLEIPDRPLCSESCKGICAECGADLNNGPCGCHDAEAGKQPSWKADIEKLRGDV